MVEKINGERGRKDANLIAVPRFASPVVRRMTSYMLRVLYSHKLNELEDCLGNVKK